MSSHRHWMHQVKTTSSAPICGHHSLIVILLSLSTGLKVSTGNQQPVFVSPASVQDTCKTSTLTITSSQIQVCNQSQAKPLPLQPVASSNANASGGIPQDVLALVRNQQALDAQRGLASAQMVNTILGLYVNK